MAQLWQIQSNMNRGELDPLLAGRTDLQAYYNGVYRGRNVSILPQGGMKKRPGLEYIEEIESVAGGIGRLENFSYSTTQNYLLCFVQFRMYIFKNGILMTNINGSGNDYLTIGSLTGTIVQEMDYNQSVDTIIITHEAIPPLKIVRSSDTTWTASAITFTVYPQYDFDDASSPTPVTEVQTLTFTNANEGDRYKLSLEGVLTEEIAYSSDTTTNENNIRYALLGLINTADTGITVTFNATLYEVYFANASANDWDLLVGTAISTQSTSFNIATARTATGTSRKENVWSATRGWPRTNIFHEGRLWFGGSELRPSTLWGSRVFNYFNFDPGKGYDDEAIEFTLDTDQVNAINAVFSNRQLQVFTSGGEFYVPQSPVTPENVSVRFQSNIGSKRQKPVTIDGVTLFVQRTGKAIYQFVYLDEYQANQANNISTISSHLIVNPTEMCTKKGSSENDANYVYIVNSDGTLDVFNTLAAEDVSGFTLWEIDGYEIISASVVDDELYLLVAGEFVPGAGTAYYLLKENSDLYTDAAYYNTSLGSATVTGLDHLEGNTVWARADGAFMGEFTVSSGSITLERTATEVEVGLEMVPLIQTMPLNTSLANGPNAFAKKKIARIGMHLYESNGVIVNGERLADKTLGVDQFDAPDPFTGLKRIHVLGWSIEAQVTITQDTPMPLTVLGIGTEIAV